MKIKQIKPKVKKVNYKLEEQEKLEETIQDVDLKDSVSNALEQLNEVSNMPTSSLSAVSLESKKKIQKSAEFAKSKSMSNEEIDNKAKQLSEQIEDMLNKYNVDGVKQAIEEEKNEMWHNSSSMSETSQVTENNANEEELKDNTKQKSTNEEQKDNASCSQTERAFLDEFYNLQEAGKLLGMVMTTSNLENSDVLNLEIYPRINKVLPSDKLKMDEQNADVEVYSLMTLKILDVVKLIRKMLSEKGL